MTRKVNLIAPLTLLLGIGALMLAGCSGGDGGGDATPTRPVPTSTSAPAAPAATASPAPSGGGGTGNNITMADFSYSPQRFNARVGQPVQLTVTNAGQLPHTFTINDLVDSGSMSAGQTKVITFTPIRAGTLIFFCTIHGQNTMSGQVLVAGTSGSLPPPSDDAGTTKPPAADGADALTGY